MRTSDPENIFKRIPRYLFRVHSSTSQGTFSSFGFRSGQKPFFSEESYEETRSLVSAHLLWHKAPSPWISTTSSLLWALVYARWKLRNGDKDTSISLVASDRIEKTTIFPSMYLVKYYNLDKVGKIRHDKPEGEYLVKWRITGDAVRSSVRYQDVAKEFDDLVPELASGVEDRPSQATSELRRVCFPKIDLEKASGGTPRTDMAIWPFTIQDYVSAGHIARSFNNEEARVLLTMMCLSFRRRDLFTLKNILGHLMQESNFGKAGSTRTSTLTIP